MCYFRYNIIFIKIFLIHFCEPCEFFLSFLHLLTMIHIIDRFKVDFILSWKLVSRVAGKVVENS